MALIGYARVSTPDQKLDLQLDALQQAGCVKIFTDTKSGASDTREGLSKALDYCRDHDGDTLVVWKLDRLGRTLKGLLSLTADLEQRGIGFKSLSDPIDTTSAFGMAFFHIMATLAELERNLLLERTRAGIQSARMRGRLGGRPFRLTRSQEERIWTLAQDRETNLTEVAQDFDVHVQTIYRTVKRVQQRKDRQAQQADAAD